MSRREQVGEGESASKYLQVGIRHRVEDQHGARAARCHRRHRAGDGRRRVRAQRHERHRQALPARLDREDARETGAAHGRERITAALRRAIDRHAAHQLVAADGCAPAARHGGREEADVHLEGLQQRADFRPDVSAHGAVHLLEHERRGADGAAPPLGAARIALHVGRGARAEVAAIEARAARVHAALHAALHAAAAVIRGGRRRCGGAVEQNSGVQPAHAEGHARVARAREVVRKQHDWRARAKHVADKGTMEVKRRCTRVKKCPSRSWWRNAILRMSKY